MSSGLYLLVALTVAAAACAQGSFGVGFGMLASPILALIEPRLVPGPLLCAAVVLMVLVVLRERGALDAAGVRWAIAGRVPGTLIGAAAVAALPQQGVTMLVAVLVLVAVALSVAGLHVRPTPTTNFGAGAASGFMGTITSVGGPAMALLYQREKAARLRSTLSLFFLFGAAFSLTTLVVTGNVGRSEVGLGLALLPPTLAGYALSARAIRWLDRGRTRTAILWLSGLASVAVLAREALGAL